MMQVKIIDKKTKELYIIHDNVIEIDKNNVILSCGMGQTCIGYEDKYEVIDITDEE